MNENDLLIIQKQLKRKIEGVLEIKRRCKYGYPQVILSSPYLRNKPFPTLFWLTCPFLIKEISKLEAQGWISRFEEMLKKDDNFMKEYESAHKEEIILRRKIMEKMIMPSWVKDTLKNVGIGGIRNFSTIKCLHLHVASYLAGMNNPVGRFVINELLKNKTDCPNDFCNSFLNKEGTK